ncbi:hypothetical protein MJO28_016201 [Puccinia striiformis f. sp. tritici]|uniref:Uncharacterized protein n=2 Tax=Puccinia striiformis TaxID=27350 RepID=A0A2S4UJ92_9BASI|nr:hypothetical protein MJO28_016201 [Puccinia striiformis f. sp. tritici]POV97320.1 hypothetical protein PSTT_15129 [Puccinia striiformis]
MYESDSTSEPVEEYEEHFRHQGQMVIRGFENLVIKYNSQAVVSPGPASTQEAASTISIDEVNSNGVVLNQLVSYLLPLLKGQLATLSRLLEPEDLRRDPGARLKLIAEFQPGLDHNMSQIACVIAFISPVPLQSSDRADDQQLRHFKSFWLGELNDNISDLRFQVSSICRSACDQIEKMNLYMTLEYKDTLDTEVNTYEECITETLGHIDFVVKCLKRSELDAIEEHWAQEVHRMDSLLGRSTRRLVDSARQTSRQLTKRNRSVHELVIHLTKLAIPIIKLSRLFFQKLSRRGMNGKHLQSFTKMNSKQLRFLSESARRVAKKLVEILNILSNAQTDPEIVSVDTHVLPRGMEHLASRFEAPLLLVVLYLIPLIPETDPDQKYYRDWFSTWNIQIILAIDRFQLATRSFARIP